MKGTKPQLVVDNDAVREAPAPPEWMGEEAKKEWRRVIDALVDRGIFTEADAGNLENYCVAQGHVREFQRELSVANSSEAKARFFRMQNQAMATARQLAAELGLTPISRARPFLRDLFDGEDDDPTAL
jgi:P27 family predicted phage terminase small subunit